MKASRKHLLKELHGHACSAVICRQNEILWRPSTRLKQNFGAVHFSGIRYRKASTLFLGWRSHPQTCWVFISLGGGQSDH